jgi:hypothetical protein
MSSDDAPSVDRNKSALTQRITARAVLCLYEMGFKPVETEVPLAPGWTADVAGVITPTKTEAVRLKLVKPKPRDPTYTHSEAFMRRLGAWEETYAALPSPMTALLEVKAERRDFTRDRKWTRQPPTNLCFLAVPKGVVRDADEYPAGWYVMEYGAGGGLRVVRHGGLFPVSQEQQLENVLAVAVRRDHATRYARKNEMRKLERIEEVERLSRVTPNKALAAVLAVVRGRGISVEMVLRSHQIKDPDEYLVAELRTLWNTAPAASQGT